MPVMISWSLTGENLSHAGPDNVDHLTTTAISFAAVSKYCSVLTWLLEVAGGMSCQASRRPRRRCRRRRPLRGQHLQQLGVLSRPDQAF